MSDLTASSPAGGSEQTSTSDFGSMSISGALDTLAELDKEPEGSAAAEQGDDAQNIENIPEQGEPADNADEPGEETASDEDVDQPADDAETEADETQERIHGNTRTRLRDGTEVTIADLKKGYDELREFRAKGPELTAAAQRAQELEARIAQQEQFVRQYQEIVPVALARLQTQLQPPNPENLNRDGPHYDPVQFLEDKEKYEQDIAEIQRFANTYRAQQQQEHQQREAADKAKSQKLYEEGRKVLLEKIPEMAEPVKAKAVYENIVSICARYGISKELVDTTPNPHLFHMIHTLSSKAEAYDKLMAQKPAVQEKAKSAAPVQQPGRRVNAAEATQRNVNERIKRWRESDGGLSGALTILETI